MGFRIADTDFNETAALPADAGSGAATNTDALDLLTAADGADRLADCELKVSAPALTTDELPDDCKIHYRIEESSDDSAWSTLAEDVIVQTGDSGADAATARLRLPTDCPRYVRLYAEGEDITNTVGDCSDKDMTLELLF